MMREQNHRRDLLDQPPGVLLDAEQDQFRVLVFRGMLFSKTLAVSSLILQKHIIVLPVNCMIPHSPGLSS